LADLTSLTLRVTNPDGKEDTEGSNSVSSYVYPACHEVVSWYHATMPTNIEIKFRVNDLDAVERKAALIADGGPELLVQEDVFFNAREGRLKLRKFADASAQLIAYHRSDSGQLRESVWHACPVADPDSLQGALAMTVGVGVTVRKHRTLYLIGNTRVHLDRVEQLGDFVELEVVLAAEDTHESGMAIAAALIDQIGLQDAEKVSVAYADLIVAKGGADPQLPVIIEEAES